ncbi:MAG: hypothetical protein E7358_00735 [Clostridiales bacterium]|nr:hypothetical protein [Clostridiales bacterium]
MFSKSINKKKTIKIILSVFLFFLIICLSVFPEKYSKSTFNGISLFAVSVLPSLLPYFFLTAILSRLNVLSCFCKAFDNFTKKVFNLNGYCIYAFLMSILSGYPVGSKIILELHSNRLISDSESSRLSLLASTSGPLFIIGAVGSTMFQNKLAGVIIYITHVLSAILTCLIFRKSGTSSQMISGYEFNDNNDQILYDSVYSSIISCLIVGGFVSVFFVISQILIDFKILYPISLLFSSILAPISSGNEGLALSVGLIEFTNGSKMLSLIGTTPITVSISCFIITFGGISGILQSLVFLNKAKVKSWFFILGKVIQATIASVICYFACYFFL